VDYPAFDMNRRTKDWLFIGVCGLIIAHWVYTTVYLPNQARSPKPTTATSAKIATETPTPFNWNTASKPTSDYKRRTVEGFDVFIDASTLDNAQKFSFDHRLNSLLRKISTIVEPEQLAKLRKVKIWFSSEQLVSIRTDVSSNNFNQPQSPEAHTAAGWYIVTSAQSLQRNGGNPDKAKSVEVGSLKDFVEYDMTTQLAIVLHELAHAYHDRVLKYNNPKVQATYDKAMTESKIYRKTNLDAAGNRVIYATTNSKEYFAELTVAYLANNIKFPHLCYEIARTDRAGYQLMQEVWGKSKSHYCKLLFLRDTKR
jgi:hypothetical protein